MKFRRDWQKEHGAARTLSPAAAPFGQDVTRCLNDSLATDYASRISECLASASSLLPEGLVDICQSVSQNSGRKQRNRTRPRGLTPRGISPRPTFCGNSAWRLKARDRLPRRRRFSRRVCPSVCGSPATGIAIRVCLAAKRPNNTPRPCTAMAPPQSGSRGRRRWPQPRRATIAISYVSQPSIIWI